MFQKQCIVKVVQLKTYTVSTEMVQNRRGVVITARLHDNDNPYTRSSPTSYVPLLKILQTFSVIRRQLPVSKLSDLETCPGQKIH